MDVGQVQFQIIADGLDSTLQKVTALQETLNGIDGRAYHTGASQRTKDEHAYNRAVQRSLRNHKQLINQTQREAEQYHKQSEKRIKDQMRIHKQDAKNQEYARKYDEAHAKRQKDLRAEQARLEKQIAINDHKQQQIDKANAIKAPKEYQKNWETTFARTGARMQTLGATLQRVTSPFMNVYRGLAMGIGYRALGKVMESINGAFSRYDTMKTYGTLLKELGMDTSKKFAVGTGEAMTAVDNLEQSVLGLPTGLDEMVDAMKRYAGATGDVERATKLAIAANNAYIAGGMDDRQKLFTERQLLSLAGGAELSTNQWDSLRRNAPLAIRAVAKQMKMSVNDMITGLKEGEIAGQDFLDVFIKVGTEGRLSKAAQKMKQTWNAVSQNISNAMNRMGAGILDSLDAVFEKTHGKSFLQYVLGVDKNGNATGGGIKGAIDDISKAAQAWIKANPEKISGFIDNLANIDWKGMASGFAQFGLTMGRIMSGLLKTFGGKGLVNFMLWGNMAGKGIQIAGGITKGLAGPLSKIMTAFKFSESARIIQNAKNIKKNGKTLVAATKTVGTMALTWQQVANRAVGVAAIPAFAWALKEIALAFQEFDKANINWGTLIEKLGQASLAIGWFATIAGGLGALMSSTPIGWAATGIATAGLGAILGISLAMRQVAQGLTAISDAEIPSYGRIKQVTDAMNEVAKGFKAKNPFEAIGIVFDAWSKGAEFESISKMTQAFEDMKALGKLKMGKKTRERMLKNISDIMALTSDLEAFFQESDEKQEKQAGTTNGALWRSNTNRVSNYQNRLNSFMDVVSSLSNGLASMQSLITNAESLQKMYNEMGTSIMRGQSSFSWEGVKRTMQSIADGMFSLTEGGDESVIYKLKQVSERTKGASLDEVSGTLGKIPEILKQLVAISELDTSGISEVNLDTIGTALSRGITKLVNALGGDFGGGASALAMKAGSLSTGVTALKKAINKMNNLPMAQDLGAVVESVENAVAELNAIGTQAITMSITLVGKVDDGGIPQKIADIAKAIDDNMKSLKSFYSKNITVSISGTVNDWISAKVDSMIASLRSKFSKTTHLIKKVNVSVSESGNYSEILNPGHMQHGGTVYRAGGGSIPRGTDTVNTWLTPGEFVLKRRASAALGHSLLYKLNNLDIRGALNELSLRANTIPRSGVVNNTTNNTRNINLNMNNYGQDSTGRGRTTGWLNRL